MNNGKAQQVNLIYFPAKWQRSSEMQFDIDAISEYSSSYHIARALSINSLTDKNGRIILSAFVVLALLSAIVCLSEYIYCFWICVAPNLCRPIALYMVGNCRYIINLPFKYYSIVCSNNSITLIKNNCRGLHP